MMTVPKDHYIKIPTWLLIIIVPIFISGITALVTTQRTNAALIRQVEINTKKVWEEIPSNMEKKVDKGEFDAFKKQIDNQNAQLTRIEEKLDQHIAKEK
jgi:hypothetical protein